MTGRDVTSSFASTLVDEWVRSGLTHAVVSPGSRNTPLVLALARDGRLRVDVVLDERSAAFRALGVGLASGRPAIVCCTSGTAAANMHPAVIEAHHARVPLLVCTADRPPALRDWGAGADPSVVHRFAAAAGWPVLADAVSQLRTDPQTVSTYEALLRSEEFARAHRPELVIRLGAPLTSKVANAWLDTDVPHVVID